LQPLFVDAEKAGATLLQPWKREGNLIHPLLIDHVTLKMKLAWEEQFGPVLPIIRIKSAQEAVEHCNCNRFALQGCVFTRDVNRAIQLSDAMRTGTVQVCDFQTNVE
jgi:glyceraldehyde-3-phosphate dehydrogenase (NADP+)